MINNNKIPTAEEYFNKKADEYSSDKEDIPEWMIEEAVKFAQLHVEAALKAAWENWEFEEGCDTHGVSLKEESILNAYPKENIL